jgi:hypothetical protein
MASGNPGAVQRGWKYTFIYELGEGEGGGGNQGLFHVDWTPKLAATYIHNLTSILADPIALANPDRLDYSIQDQLIPPCMTYFCKKATVHSN